MIYIQGQKQRLYVDYVGEIVQYEHVVYENKSEEYEFSESKNDFKFN